MPGLSKVIVLDPDARASRQVQFGFGREGIPAEAPPADAPLEMPGDDTGLVVVGGGNGHGVDLVRRARAWIDARGVDAPIVFTGRADWHDAMAAGADEVLRPPAYLRDVVTIGRLLRGVPAGRRDHIVGNLIEVTGVFNLVRALAALGRSATLTLVRGLRRGEIRFYLGEVTSAQVGMSHGQAALHQLLLWTDARFDFHHQDVVRRQQIPLPPDELFADAERFLEGVRESSGGLSPAVVLEQDIPRVQSFGKQIPTEVYGVLRMFDGHRALADVLEDSAYRVFETLRVAQRAVEAGLLRAVENQPPRPSWRAILAIEDWLVGSEPRDAVVDSGPIATGRDSGPIAARPGTGGGAGGAGAAKGGARKRKGKKKRARVNTPIAIDTAGPAALAKQINWGALVPRIVGAEVGPLAGVVPASEVSGEIVTAARAPRAQGGGGGGEGGGDAGGASSEHAAVASEPTVVFDEAAELARDAAAERAAAEEHAEIERIAAEAHARDEAERAAAEKRAAVEAARVAARARGVAAEEAERAAAEAKAAEEAERAAAEAKAAEETERAAAEAKAAEETERAAAEAKAAEEAERAAAEAEKAAAIRVVADTVSVSSDGAKVVRDLDLIETKRERGFAPGQRIAAAIAARMAAESAGLTGGAVIEDSGNAPSDAITAPMAAVTPSEFEPAPIDEARPSGAPAPVADEPVPAAAEPASAAAVAATTEPTPSEIADEPSDGVIRHHIATAETAPVKRRLGVPERIENDRPGDTTGEITMRRHRPSLEIRYSEPSILVADLAAAADAPPTEATAAEPTALAAEPTALAAELTPLADQATAAEPTDEPTPPADEPTLSATAPTPTAAEPTLSAAEPTLLAAEPTPTAAEPTLLAAEPAPLTDPPPPPADEPPPPTAEAVAATDPPPVAAPADASADDDAATFSDTEEAFFREGHGDAPPPAHTAESFDDLDEGYQRVGFWDRLRGKPGKPRE